ncbi:Paraquat-inducible protein B [Rhodovulum sp. P5]|uniref:MlaD family protein n=1 Tax=Rhodovulum sp. P5 TaxID=1564506 RepID=UPI0009C35908|nr:MlaD family protein [Rhodovulum sp. P5]ARE41805.1 Paraquat-inducible protein B [Rhodovulum sp. P5]
MSADLPPMTPVEPARKSLLERLSIVWLVPALALAIALGVAWHSYADRGPLLELVFENASGIRAGQTELRYRDVTVGVVEKVAFTEGLGKVLVSVRMEKEVADYVDDKAAFWVVRPEVTTQGVTGLNTVLSGIFIEGIWDQTPGGFSARHVVSPDAPLNREGRDGLRLRLRAAGTSALSEAAPIVYRGIEVGRIGKAQITGDGATVEAEAIIYAPHDRLITTATRFWNQSGVSFSLGPGGARVEFSSLAAMLSGGITFQTVVSGGDRVTAGTTFEVYADEATARASVFARGDGDLLTLTAIFSENVAGLTVGAPVDLGGLRVGQVTALNGIVDEDRFGDNDVRLATTLAIEPGQLGLADEVTAETALDYLETRVAGGLRARLATASILTGGLKVELIQLDDAVPAALEADAEPNPLIPTAPSNISDVADTAEGLYKRVNALPIEALMQSAIDALNSVSSLAGSEDIRAIPVDLGAVLADVQGFVGSEDMQALPGRISGTVARLDALVAELEAREAASHLAAAMDNAAEAAQSVSDATAGLPDLVGRLTGIAETAEGLPLDELAARTSALLDSADRLIDTDAARALPEDLSAALDELAKVLRSVREGGVIENANATMASARSAADDISAAAGDLPEVLRRTEIVLDQAASTIRGYDASQGLGRDLDLAIREVQRAAEAVASLAKALERDSRSLFRR